MLAHELRNPLAPIRNAGELLSRSLPADAPMRTAVHTIERQVTHLTRLVDDLLDVSRITQGRIELRRRPTSVADIVARSLETVDPLIRRKQHKVSIAGSHWNLYVNVDPERLVQCLANVLTNAAKYTEPGGEIHIETRDEGGEVIDQRHRQRRGHSAGAAAQGVRACSCRANARWIARRVDSASGCPSSSGSSKCTTAACTSPAKASVVARRFEMRLPLHERDVVGPNPRRRRSRPARAAFWWWTTTRMRPTRWR